MSPDPLMHSTTGSPPVCPGDLNATVEAGWVDLPGPAGAVVRGLNGFGRRVIVRCFLPCQATTTVVSTPPPPTASPTCASRWSQSDLVFNNQVVTYSDALANCEAIPGKTLVSIASICENDIVAAFLGAQTGRGSDAHSMWIGCKATINDTCDWEDGSTSSFTRWLASYPRSAGQAARIINPGYGAHKMGSAQLAIHGGQWESSDPNTARRRSVCGPKAPTAPPTAPPTPSTSPPAQS
eukprot:gene46711-biopygen93957